MTRMTRKSYRPLGDIQLLLLSNMRDMGGYWQPGCGWDMQSTARTRRIMETLIARALVRRVVRERKGVAEKFEITTEGLAMLPPKRREEEG